MKLCKKSNIKGYFGETFEPSGTEVSTVVPVSAWVPLGSLSPDVGPVMNWKPLQDVSPTWNKLKLPRDPV